MTRPVLMARMPVWLMLIVASVLAIACLARDTLVAATDHQIQLWKYQLRVHVAVELGKMKADSVPIVADTLPEVAQ